MAAPSLPQSFPCWVRAIYSWGGEEKGDLGFMEGDYIECLNAGDGSWWVGRLRRDRRVHGKFPSNFVKVLDAASQPSFRNASPSITRTSTNTSSGTATPADSPPPSAARVQNSKSSFRKAFSAYEKVQYKDARSTQSPPGSVNKSFKPKPYSSMKLAHQAPSPQPSVRSRPPSPKIPRPVPRGSPAPSAQYQHLPRAASPLPHYTQNRAPSPSPLAHISRAPTPQTYDDQQSDSPPPPPPPKHRSAMISAPVSQMPDTSYYDVPQHENVHVLPRTPSPALSDRHTGMTPSPLRDAMNDVMTSLEGMGLSRNPSLADRNDETQSVWSPDAFDGFQTTSQPLRSHTSIGIGYQGNDEVDASFDNPYDPRWKDEDQGIDGYVQRMQQRLDEIAYEQDGTANDDTGHDTSYFPRSKSRPASPTQREEMLPHTAGMQRGLKSRKSAYELGKQRLSRTFTTKSSTTNASSAVQSTSTNQSGSTQITAPSLMSGYSAGGFSATSAGSLARRKWGRGGSIKERPKSMMEIQRPSTAMSGVSQHSINPASDGKRVFQDPNTAAQLGNLTNFNASPEKRRGFFRRALDAAKTGAATARSNLSSAPNSRPGSSASGIITESISSTSASRALARDLGMGAGGASGVDWVQMRRDVNRSNSLSQNERSERQDRCQMMDIPVINPTSTLTETVEGGEGIDGRPVSMPTDFSACNLAMVDKSARFVNHLPAIVNASSLAQAHLCRPYRSDVQRLRAIFTWVAERIAWEEDFEGQIDTRRIIQTRRGCSEEITALVAEMCNAIGIHCEIVRGYLKSPGELVEDYEATAARPNHWWNTVLADNEWRIMDCSLANPTNPRRSAYSSAGSQAADGWWFLTKPTEICYTHIPLLPEHQRIVPSLPHHVLLALPVASSPFFKNEMQMWEFDTSLQHIEGLEMAHIQLSVPGDVECVAEVEARSFARDADGDFFESGETVYKRALAQGEFVTSKNSTTEDIWKRYTIKAVLPASSGSLSLSSNATLKIYAGRRGLMHSIASNPHSLALSLPLQHTGQNPDYEFFTRHPTPHALRHELYVAGPLCKKLVCNSTFVFSVRQHPAVTGSQKQKRPRSPSPSLSSFRPASALSIARPGSAMSMSSVSASGSAYSQNSSNASSNGSSESAREKPAKLAIQSPSGKIMRMTRKAEPPAGGSTRTGRRRGGPEDDNSGGVVRVGSLWESVIKIGEKGTWRGLVLADRTARWCVFGEWDCV